VTFIVTRDSVEFAAAAERFLHERIEYNVLATILVGVLDGRFVDSSSVFAYAVDAEGSIESAALRTPPWPMISSELEPVRAGELIDGWLAQDPDLNGVNAVPETARAIAAAWAQRTGGSTRCRTKMAMHQLEAVTDPPRPARGALRPAVVAERELLTSWWQGFVEDAGVIGGGARAIAAVDARLADDGLFVWADDEPVSLVAITRPVAGLVRIGPVYTPPEYRRRGYAGSAVAAVSRRALSDGAHRCLLFTDLANPTSNKIYAEIGYRRFADWEEHEFEPRSSFCR